MKKVLRGILNFLERKWPDVVPFTEQDKATIQDVKSHEERIKKLEGEMQKFNVALGFNMPSRRGAIPDLATR